MGGITLQADARPHRSGLREAFDLLDTGSILAVLRDLAIDGAAQDSQAVPAGARFVTFVYADRILGLDLARGIGQARS
jgi:predicted GNAT superfamily acetyltransferase